MTEPRGMFERVAFRLAAEELALIREVFGDVDDVPATAKVAIINNSEATKKPQQEVLPLERD